MPLGIGDDFTGDITRAFQGTKGTTYFVDSAASDSNSGTSWADAKATIQAALDLCTGGNTVFVATGGYTLTLTTPTNATAPFCQLIGVNSTDMGYGPWLMSTTAGQANLTIRARGWRISGFEFDLRATGAAIILDKQTSSATADYTVIDHCLFAGSKNSTIAINFKNNVRMATIRDCEFFDIYNGSGTGQAIGCSYSTTAVPYHLRILNNIFRGNNKHISFDGVRGPNYSLIENNLLIDSADKTATLYCSLAGGTEGYNVVRRNVFGGTYSEGGGYYTAQATDIWVENYLAESMVESDALPG